MGSTDTCAVCGESGRAVKVDGTLRRHPRGSAEPCAGSDHEPGWTVPEYVAPPEPEAAEPPPLPPVGLRPGTYRPTEPMMDPVEIPPGHIVAQITVVYPWPADGESPKAEASRLYDDPAYLYRVLDGADNDHVRLLLKVPSP